MEFLKGERGWKIGIWVCKSQVGKCKKGFFLSLSLERGFEALVKRRPNL